MKITKSQLRQIIKEELEAAQTERSPLSSGIDFGPRPQEEPPINFTTADLTGEQFAQLIDAWGAPDPKTGKSITGSNYTSEQIYEGLGGRPKLIENYEWLRNTMKKEGAGKLPRKFMPVIKKGFIEDLLVRLKAGKLDFTQPWAPTGGEMKVKKTHLKKRGFRVPKDTMSSTDAAAATATAADRVTERFSADFLHNLIVEILSEVSQERYEKYKSLRKQGYSPGQQQHLPNDKFPSGANFDAMANPKKSRRYWLEKGHMDGNETDDIVGVEFGTAPVTSLHPSQDRVYADKIAWKLLELGPNRHAPLKDKELVDGLSGPVSAPDWRYRSIVIDGGLLLDGHHKWALASLSGAHMKVPTLFLPGLNLRTTIKLLRSYGAAHGFAGQA